MTIALGTLMPATVTITPTVPAARDRDRLAALLEPALAPGWRLAATICGPDLAADAVQEACLRAVVLQDRFRPDAPFLPWFLALVRAQALHQARSAARRRARFGGAPPPERPEPEREPAPEAAALLPAALAALRPEHRDAVVLRHGEGLDFPAIAVALACRERTARTWVARGMDALERWFAARGFRSVGLGAMLATDWGSLAPPADLAGRCRAAVRTAPATASGTGGIAPAAAVAMLLIALAAWFAGGDDPGPASQPTPADPGIRVVLRGDAPEQALAAIAMAAPDGLRWVAPDAPARAIRMALAADPWPRDRLLDALSDRMGHPWIDTGGLVRLRDGAVETWIDRYAEALASPHAATLAAAAPPEGSPVNLAGPRARIPAAVQAIADPRLAAAWARAVSAPEWAPAAVRHLRWAAVPEAATGLRRLVDDAGTVTSLRQAAIGALDRLRDPGDRQRWQRLQQDAGTPRRVRIAALLADLALPGSATRCRALLTGTPDEDRRGATLDPDALGAIARIALDQDPDPARTVDLLLAATGAAQAAILEAAAVFGIPATDPRLPAWWRTQPPDRDAAWVATWGGPAMVTALLAAVTPGDPIEEPGFIATRLRENRRPGVLEALADAARGSATAPRRAALMALAQHRDPRALGLVQALLPALPAEDRIATQGILLEDPRHPVDATDWDAKTLVQAWQWSHGLSPSLREAVVARALLEQDREARRCLVGTATADRPDPPSPAWSRAVAQWSADPDPCVRGWAGQAWASDPARTADAAQGTLVGMLTDPAPFVRAMGAFAAGMQAVPPDAVSRVLADLAIADPHPQVRVRAASALVWNRPEILERLLHDPDPGVRARAVEGLALARRNPVSLRPLLRELRVREPEASVRAVIDAALEDRIQRIETWSPVWEESQEDGLHRPRPEDVLRSRG
ncbi:MAG: hypothetical protein RLZZ127_561 [Planctomycetota bacterium]|jgi:RNA polymerase sigma-70 factor (ECF subfamily)